MVPGDRYEKQRLFKEFGDQGQERLAAASLLIVGAGALGGYLGQLLVRAGVGRVVLVDCDRPELSNLHRQIMFDEDDLAGGRNKALISAAKLSRANSEAEVQGLAVELDRRNVLELMAGAALTLDALDNTYARYLLNDAAVHLGKPWIHTGVVAARGNVMPVIPGRTPCLRCLFPNPPPPEAAPTVNTMGIIGPTPAFAASLAAAEAVKFLIGEHDRRMPGMFSFDFWQNSFEVVQMSEGPVAGCPCCDRRDLAWLEGRAAQ